MKQNYILTAIFTVVITAFSFAQTTVFQESFELETFNDSQPETCLKGSDFFTRTDGSISSYSVSGQDGAYFFAAQDIDGSDCADEVNDADNDKKTKQLFFDDIDISGHNNLTLAVLLAEDKPSDSKFDWDSVSKFYIEVDVDNSGTFQKVLQVATDGSSNANASEPMLDTNLDGIGDGTIISSVFTEFTASIASGNLVDVRLVFDNLKAGDEDIAVDNIRLINDYVTSPILNVLNPIDGKVFNPGTTSVDVEFSTDNINLIIAGNQVNVTVNSDAPATNVTSPFSITTVDGESYDVTVELLERNTVVATKTTSFTVGSITQAANIAALRAGAEGDFFELTGEVFVTHVSTAYGGKKYIQDATGAILIYDTAENLTTSFNVGDGITGLKGKLASRYSVVTIEPLENVAAASSTGNVTTPQVITLSELNSNGEAYESKLITLENIEFADAGGTFASSKNYDVNVSGAAETAVCRTDFSDSDLIGVAIPTGAVSMTGLASEFNGTRQIFPRTAADIVSANLSITAADAAGIALYPNPTATGSVSIVSAKSAAISVVAYNVVGAQVLATSLTGTTLDVSALNTGVYILKITQDGATITKKLVIK